MPTFAGNFQLTGNSGSPSVSGACQLSFDEETLTVTPSSGAPLTLDLGDIDVFAPGDYDLALTLYSGNKLTLNRFGKAFQNLAQQLLEAHRRRLVQCLLLEDLEEIARFDAFAHLQSSAGSFSSPAELRLYKSNLAVLPTQATGCQWRLADLDAVVFDKATYAVTLSRGDDRLSLTKLAKRTEEFQERLNGAMADIKETAAQILHRIFPFLNPDEFRQAAELMKEGRAIPLAGLKAIHAKTEQALVSNAVGDQQRPYFQALLALTAGGAVHTGFKLIREESGDGEESPQAGNSEAGREVESAIDETRTVTEARVADEGEKGELVLHWFFFPIASQQNARQSVLAWEATSEAGRATYFFRAGGDSSDGAIRDLNRALVLVNFRREPIYLSDDALALDSRHRRYAIACRKFPELRRLRASFIGRAIHTNPAAWEQQVKEIITKAQ